MNCLKCNANDLTEKDFYWHTDSIPARLKNPKCLKCMSEARKEKLREKNKEREMYGV